LRQARWCVGVVDLIHGEAAPTKVSDALIESFRAREGKGGLIPLPKPEPFRRGDPVQIVRGALLGLDGIFEGIRGSEVVAIMLPPWGKSPCRRMR
jgi:hypothetical protein